ncbi:MAG: hypothetical protein AB1758_38335, partial [Candidatus Eremiobacterota bacterium]
AVSMPARADIFDLSVDYYQEGVVNLVQPTWFCILRGAYVTRVMMPPGQQLPPQLMVGTPVRVTLSRDQSGTYYLKTLEVMEQPNGLPVNNREPIDITR